MALECGNCKAYCCRAIGKLMPELDRGDSTCIYLTNDNKCAIYNDRPLLCNTDKVYDKYFSKKYSKEQWIELNKKACEDLHERYKSSI
jgi:Fe-S-cluster containining protein